MDPFPVILLTVTWILSAAAAILLVSNRGEDLVVWAPLSVAFGPLALVLAYFRTGTTCPYCFGRIHREAMRCPHCRQDISLRDELVFARRGPSAHQGSTDWSSGERGSISRNSSDHLSSGMEREHSGAKVASQNSPGRPNGFFGSSNRLLGSYFFLAALYGLMILLAVGWTMVFLLNLE